MANCLPCFGEVVDYRKRTQDKLEGRWNEGIVLGVRLTSSEKIIGTENGIFVVQSIRRKPESDQYNAAMNCLRGSRASHGSRHLMELIKGTQIDCHHPWLSPRRSLKGFHLRS